jgi:DNA-binding transcriptional ArsR family regulator
MSHEKFVLVSLQEDKAKKLAQVITNDSCRKILDYLSEKSATESQLAKLLGLPISTVHYNLKQLLDGGLVTADEFHYSEKGKEVLHYKLANKYIIIAPRTVYGIKEKLKSILPVILMVAAAAGFIQLFISRYIKMPAITILQATKQTVMRETIVGATDAAREAAPMLAAGAGEMAKAAAPGAANESLSQIVNITTEQILRPEVTSSVISTSGSIFSSITLWFLIGAITALAAYLVADYLRGKGR